MTPREAVLDWLDETRRFPFPQILEKWLGKRTYSDMAVSSGMAIMVGLNFDMRKRILSNDLDTRPWWAATLH